MRKLVYKYSLVIILSAVGARIVGLLIDNFWPQLSTDVNDDGSVTTYSIGYLATIVGYFFNTLVVILIEKDLRKQNLQSAPVLIVTLLSSFVGVIFFLLISLQNKLLLQSS